MTRGTPDNEDFTSSSDGLIAVARTIDRMTRLAVLLSLVACHLQTQVGIAGEITNPDAVVSSCTSQCGALGLSLQSVVLMYNSISCACRVEKR